MTKKTPTTARPELRRQHDPALKVALINLGCPKNLVDAERLLGEFTQRGWTVCPEPAGADLVLVNTCGFIDSAKQESIDTLLEVASLKKTAGVRAVVGLGCLIERYHDELAKQIPEIDAWAGLVHPTAVEALCRRLLEGGVAPELPLERRDARQAEVGRLRLTPRFYAYLRIAEGCDNRCNYCVIPIIRGPYISKPREAIVQEAEELAADGAVEINLIAQDTTRYGLDLYGRPALPELLGEIAAVPAVRWIRLLYTHPAHFDDAVIEVLAAQPKMCHYIDLPVQHINDAILERMGRKVKRSQIERLIERLREAVPDIAVRTSLIVGFPGETEGQFEELLEFVRQTRFDRFGAFTYSREEGTAAYSYPNQIPEREKRRRLDAVMRLQQEISLELNRSRVGRDVAVLIESRGERGEWEGRTEYDAPEIDGRIFLRGPDLSPGRICTVNVTGTRGHYDLEGALRANDE